MNSGVLAFDGTGRIKALSVADFPLPKFNGGTPTGELGSLVVGAFASGYTAEAWVGGLPYTFSGALVVDFFGSIAHHVAGIPMTANGVAVDAGDAISWAPGGLPLSVIGKLCLAVTDPVDVHAFNNGFDQDAFS